MEMIRDLSVSQEAQRMKLINEVQNLIWALEFEEGPKPGEPGRVAVDFNAGMLFAIVYNLWSDLTHPKKYPWQEIVIEKFENKNPFMYEVLKAAKKALEETKSQILIAAKNKHAGEYDKVETRLGGKQPSTSGYGYFAKKVGSVTNHPGTLVGDIVGKVDEFFQDLMRNEPKENVEIKTKYF